MKRHVARRNPITLATTFLCSLAIIATSLITSPSPAHAGDTYYLRLTKQSWMTQIDSKSNPNWPETPDTAKSYLSYISAQEPGTAVDYARKTKFMKYLTYTLTDSSGEPVPSVEVSFKFVLRGRAIAFQGGRGQEYAPVGVGDPQLTDDDGKVSFYFVNDCCGGYSSDHWMPNPWPSGQEPEPRPKSLLKSSCYLDCGAPWPNERWYDPEKNPTGIKVSDVFESDMIPVISPLDDNTLFADQLWFHFINPIVQAPKILKNGRVPLGLELREGFKKEQNFVGGLAKFVMYTSVGAPFSSVKESWYACTNAHKDVSFSVPKDCSLLPLAYGPTVSESEYPGFLIPAAARGKYLMGGYLVTNSVGKLFELSATWPNRIK